MSLIKQTAITKKSLKTITFNAGGGICEETERIVQVGVPIGELHTVTKSGFDFVGWFTILEGGVEVTSETTIDDNVTFYAHFELQKFTVTFNGNGGSSTTRTVVIGNKVGSLPGSSRTGYTFKGWYTAASGGTAATENDIIIKDTTYYAHWEVVMCTITYNANGHGTDPATKQIAYGSSLNSSYLPIYTVDGYKVRGWYTHPVNGVQYIDGSRVTSNVTLYAHWYKV